MDVKVEQKGNPHLKVQLIPGVSCSGLLQEAPGMAKGCPESQHVTDASYTLDLILS